MYHFVIIENEEKYRLIYKKIIKELMSKENLYYYINEFTKFNKKLEDFIKDNNTYNIYLIDIHLESKYTGIDIAKEIRKNDLNSDIIFISSQSIMFEAIFKNIPKVFCFISKYQNMEKNLTKSLKTIIYFNKYMVLDKKGDLKISFKDILYIYRETTERKTYVVTCDDKYSTSLSLKDILLNYQDYFDQIHRACLINPRNIKIYNFIEGYFIAKKDKVYMCSKKYKDNVGLKCLK